MKTQWSGEEKVELRCFCPSGRMLHDSAVVKCARRVTMSERAPDAKKCAACDKASTLRCPTCKELGIEGGQGAFCSQTCFKGTWETHKLLHKAAKEAAAQQLAAAASGRLRLPGSFDGYRFSGKLRPGFVSPRMSVPAGIRKPDYADAGLPISELAVKGNNTIPVLNAQEQEHMRTACRCALAARARGCA